MRCCRHYFLQREGRNSYTIRSTCMEGSGNSEIEGHYEPKIAALSRLRGLNRSEDRSFLAGTCAIHGRDAAGRPLAGARTRGSRVGRARRRG